MKGYNNEELIQMIKNNRILLTTTHRNDEASSLFHRLTILRETKELVKIALALGLESPEIDKTLKILGVEETET